MARLKPDRRQWAYIGLYLLILAIAVAVTFSSIAALRTVTLVRETQQTGSPLLKSIQATQRTIADCTTPGRGCYERGQRQTGKAVADINRVVILAAWCADKKDAQTEDEITSCVIRALAAQDANETP